MANYFDGKIINPKLDGNPIEKAYAQGLAEVSALFDKYPEGTITLERKGVKKKWNVNKTSVQATPPISIPLRANIQVDSIGSVEVVFSRNPPLMRNGRATWLMPHEMIFDNVVLTKKEIDYAWFMLKACDLLNIGELKVVDYGVEIDAKWDKMSDQADVAKFLFSPEITEAELVAVFAAFDGGKLNYSQKESTKANAIRLWESGIGSDGAKMQELKAAIDSVSGEAKSEEAPELEMLPLPAGWKKVDILKEAEENQIELPTKPMKLEVLYSILQKKIKEKNDEF